MNIQLTGANVLMGELEGRFDGHMHVFHTQLPLLENRRYTPSYNALLADYIPLLNANQLTGALLVQPSFLGSDNHYLLNMLDEAKSYADMHFNGVVVLEANTPQAELLRLHEAGIVGMRLNLVGQTQAFNPVEWADLLRRIDLLGWHVEVHAQGPLLPSIVKTLLRYCQRVVVDHFGLPDAHQPLDCIGLQSLLAAPKEQLFVKVSAPYRVFPELSSEQAAEACQPIFQRLFDHLGTEHLLWGSDWPWTRFERKHSFKDSVDWQQTWLNAKLGSAQTPIKR